jgi:RNA polymerase sigma-70 factor (ECF subfamily)
MPMVTTTLVNKQTIDREMLVGIYEQHNAELYRYAYRLLGNRDLAEECVAETFSRFLQSIAKRRNAIDNVRAYLFRMAHNWITDHYRSSSPTALPLEREVLEDASNNPARVVAKEMERERIRATIRQLPEDQQRVIALRVLEELSHEEVAVILGKTPEATRALQYRAMKTLRRMLVEQEA